MTRNYNPSLLEEGLAAATMGVNIVLSPVTRRWYARWGSTGAERARPLPGDEIVPRPRLVSTRAITVRAPAAAVWPWLLQMGYGRGGLYSYQRLENLARCDIHNADALHAEWQQLAIGDRIGMGPEGYPEFFVRAIHPEQTLVLGSRPEETAAPVSWVFHLEPAGESVTRLIIRYRMTYPDGAMNSLMWRVFTDPIFFVMERRMLIGIRDRAEVAAPVAAQPA